MTTKPTPTVTRTVETRTEWELTYEDTEAAVREYVKAPSDASVDFDVGQCLRGATVRFKETT